MAVRRRTLLLCGTGLLSSAATLWVLLVYLAPEDRVVHVSFDALLADVKAERVREIVIHDREYTYRVRDAPLGAPGQRASGPEPTLAQVRALRPVADGPYPQIRFEP